MSYLAVPALPVLSNGLVPVRDPKPWKVAMCDICCVEPGACCEVLCCPLCIVYTQRKRVLAFTGEPYTCCAKGSTPQQGCCKPPIPPPLRHGAWDLQAPWPPLPGTEAHRTLHEFNTDLLCEVCCCLGWAMSSTRAIMHSKFRVKNTACENCMVCAGSLETINADANGMGGGACGLCFPCAVAQVSLQLKEEELSVVRGGLMLQQAAPGPAQQSMPGTAFIAQGVPVQPQPQQMQQMQYMPPQQQQQNYQSQHNYNPPQYNPAAAAFNTQRPPSPSRATF